MSADKVSNTLRVNWFNWPETFLYDWNLTRYPSISIRPIVSSYSQRTFINEIRIFQTSLVTKLLLSHSRVIIDQHYTPSVLVYNRMPTYNDCAVKKLYNRFSLLLSKKVRPRLRSVLFLNDIHFRYQATPQTDYSERYVPSKKNLRAKSLPHDQSMAIS